MLRLFKGPGAFLGLFFLVIVVSGCLSSRTDLVKQDFVRLITDDAKFVFISSVFVYNENNGTAIEGRVRRRLCCPGHIQRGHLVVDIVSPDDHLIESLVALPYPQDIPCKGSRTSSFGVKTKAPVAKNSLVSIRYKHGCPGKTAADGSCLCD